MGRAGPASDRDGDEAPRRKSPIQLSFPQRTPVTVNQVPGKGQTRDWGAAEKPEPKRRSPPPMVITPAMARTTMRRCGKVAAEKPVVAEAVSLAEAALPTMIAAGIWSCTHATQPKVT